MSNCYNGDSEIVKVLDRQTALKRWIAAEMRWYRNVISRGSAVLRDALLPISEINSCLLLLLLFLSGVVMVILYLLEGCEVLEWVCSFHLWVCLCQYTHISQKPRGWTLPNYLYMLIEGCSVLLCLHYNMLCTFVFVHNVTFLHNCPQCASFIFLSGKTIV